MELTQPELRTLSAGAWYWVSKKVIQGCAPYVGLTAIGVYHFLASMADKQQYCFPSQAFIAKRLGISRASANKAIQKLRIHKLIVIEKRNGNKCGYRLLQISCKHMIPEMSSSFTLPVNKIDTNNTPRTILNNNSGASIKHPLTAKPYYSNENTKELLIQEIAEVLEDRDRMSLYQRYVDTYPEQIIRKVLSEVKHTPQYKIKKSRGALFTYLLRLYAHKNI